MFGFRLLATSACCMTLSIASANANDEQIAMTTLGVIACSSVPSDKDRLVCFDKVANLAKASEVSENTASTKDMLASFAPGDFRIIDPADIHVAPNKYMKKPIEVRNLKCFYADKADYRCVAPGSAIVAFFVKDVSPKDEREKLENDCGSIKDIDKAKCRRNIHIVAEDADQDLVNGVQSRVVIKSASLQVLASNKRH